MDDPSLYLEAAALGDGSDAYAQYGNGVSGGSAGSPTSGGSGTSWGRSNGGSGKKVKPSSKRTKALYKDYARVVAKQAERREEMATEGCTFKPQLIARPVGAAAAAGGRRSTEAMVQYKQKSLERAEAQRKQLDPECTFAPKMEAKQYDNKRRSTTRMYEDAVKTIVRRDTLRKEQKGLTPDCTFKPAVNRRSRLDPKKDGRANPARLYNDQKLLQTKLERERLRQQREVAECTFSPEILVPAGTPGSSGKKKKKKQPATPTSSTKEGNAFYGEDPRDGSGGGEGDELAGERKAGGGGGAGGPSPRLFSRLHDHARRKEQRLAMKREQYKAKEMEGCSFTPDLKKKTPKTTRSPELPPSDGPPLTSRDFPEASGAFSRLYTNAVQQQAKMRDTQVGYVPKECTFQPRIKKKEMTKAYTPPHQQPPLERRSYLSEDQLAAKFDRMYREGTERVSYRGKGEGGGRREEGGKEICSYVVCVVRHHDCCGKGERRCWTNPTTPFLTCFGSCLSLVSSAPPPPRCSARG